MFGIELDKLLFVGVLIGLIVGPARLVEWRRKLPQMVGRVHALYQQGRAQVTRDLDDMAPDWREYDPRQLHPRRILRELGADVRTATDSAGERAKAHPQAGELPVEPMAHARDQQSRDEIDRGVDDDVEHLTGGGRQEERPGDLDEPRIDPGDDRRRPSASPDEGSGEAAAGRGKQHVEAGVHLPPLGEREGSRPEAEGPVRVPVGRVGRPRDDRGEPEENRRGDGCEPGEGSTVLGEGKDGKRATP